MVRGISAVSRIEPLDSTKVGYCGARVTSTMPAPSIASPTRGANGTTYNIDPVIVFLSAMSISSRMRSDGRVPPAPPPRFKSKNRAALAAFLLGSLGAHRFYLYGPRDALAYLHIAATALGVVGVQWLVATQRTSVAGWGLSVPGAVSLLTAFLAAIVYGLRPDDKWDARFNPHGDRRNRSGWGVVFIVILSLFIGAMLLMGALALAFQTYFEATVQPLSSVGLGALT
ncbi:TM2 domain-containing membrane protein YozV [Mycetohabitans endofungorum]|uniref:TM2 domain-containing membrane protein YozV n=2 Tax=Burkholderiaceae TaxID=119060 RepID=A0A2P5KEG0_9BURK|nr:TM2 domain-containing membrane protein YozV [Mycetohabitans endofungorum]